MRRMRSGCCARTANGQAAAARLRTSHRTDLNQHTGRGANVRFGSLADIRSAKGHVCFTRNSDRESGFPQKVMSALTPKADMCSGQEADIRTPIRSSRRRGRAARATQGDSTFAVQIYSRAVFAIPLSRSELLPGIA